MPDATWPLGAAPVAATTPAKVRDPRLDVIRGICLVMIFINHVPINVFEHFTSRNFGFSDSAEGFVLMSGIAAGLAYSSDFRTPTRLWQGVGRVWRRVWTLYLVHILCTVGALAAAAAAALFLHDSRILFQNNMDSLFLNPLSTLIGIPILGHQFGYVNILPLYLVLLFFAPALLWAALRWPMWLWAASTLLWFVTGQFYLGLPNYPLEGNWFFNPLAWQIIFVTGILTGVAMKDGRRLVPVQRGLQWLCGIFLIYAAVATMTPVVGMPTGHALWWLRETLHLPWHFVAFDKSYVTGPRLLHILALAYLLSSLPVVRRACASRFARPFEIMGRQSLSVFALGSVLCIALQGIRQVAPHTVAMDTLLVGGALLMQFALAAARQYWPKPAKG